jgi:hypothetical protein
MHVQKTTTRNGKTLDHGSFKIHETVHVCAARCRHPSGALMTQRPFILSETIMPRRAVGYDVMAFVGIERFIYHRQREEIRAALEHEHVISLSTGETSDLAACFFVEYLRRLHEARCEQLRAALLRDGGWPLHIDATGENGRGTLLVALAGWRQWVLGAWKIPTECSDAIVPCLRSLIARFGAPCAIIRDLGRAVIRACNKLTSELKLDIPILGCHLHFLRDIGIDLLDPLYSKLRDLFRHFKIRPGLRALTRDLGRRLGIDVAEARCALRLRDMAAKNSLHAALRCCRHRRGPWDDSMGPRLCCRCTLPDLSV